MEKTKLLTDTDKPAGAIILRTEDAAAAFSFAKYCQANNKVYKILHHKLDRPWGDNELASAFSQKLELLKSNANKHQTIEMLYRIRKELNLIAGMKERLEIYSLKELYDVEQDPEVKTMLFILRAHAETLEG